MARLRTGEVKRELRQAHKRAAKSIPLLHALGDWRRMVARAESEGRTDLVARFEPKEDYGWRSIDKCTDQLKAALEAGQSASDGADIANRSF
jgi:hypothetical protein